MKTKVFVMAHSSRDFSWWWNGTADYKMCTTAAVTPRKENAGVWLLFFLSPSCSFLLPPSIELMPVTPGSGKPLWKRLCGGTQRCTLVWGDSWSRKLTMKSHYLNDFVCLLPFFILGSVFWSVSFAFFVFLFLMTWGIHICLFSQTPVHGVPPRQEMIQYLWGAIEAGDEPTFVGCNQSGRWANLYGVQLKREVSQPLWGTTKVKDEPAFVGCNQGRRWDKLFIRLRREHLCLYSSGYSEDVVSQMRTWGDSHIKVSLNSVSEVTPMITLTMTRCSCLVLA